jgi:hypothetical protein
MRTAKRRWTASEQLLLEEMLATNKSTAQIGLELVAMRRPFTLAFKD